MKDLSPSNQGNDQVPLSLLIVISFFIHITVFFAAAVPDFSMVRLMIPAVQELSASSRTVKVKVAENISQHGKPKITEQTFISDKDSEASGHLTQGRQAKWYSETTDLRLPGKKGGAGQGGRISSEKVITGDSSEIFVRIVHSPGKKGQGGNEGTNDIRLPQPYEMSRVNTLFFSNSGLFSLNTVSFKHYAFAKRIVDRISSFWYPPVMANARMSGYAPGTTTILAIPPQEVKTYFIINENGDVVKKGILDSGGNRSLDDSCLDAIRLAGNFGPVPDDLKKKMKNGVMVIPFIFGYGL